MNPDNSIAVQFRDNWRTVSLALATSLFFIGILLLLHFGKGISIETLTRDPIDSLKAPFYVGFISQIGIFFWAATIAICFFTSWVLSVNTRNAEFRHFLILSGILSLVLGLDDAFLLHERVFPVLVGIPEKVVLASYAIFTLFYLFKFSSTILKTPYLILGIAFAFFTLSVAVDLIKPASIDPFLIEDGAKLTGIITWLSYFILVSKQAFNSSEAQTISSLRRTK